MARWQVAVALDEAGLPEGVREVVGRRLSELPEATNTMLGAASVLGREFDVGAAQQGRRRANRSSTADARSRPSTRG